MSVYFQHGKQETEPNPCTEGEIQQLCHVDLDMLVNAWEKYGHELSRYV